ncbi:fasciclin domain-containing protein [Nocardia takedensis]
MIGYYIHHHGAGHLVRARSICFAPMDSALAKLDPATVESLNTDSATLTTILTYHVVHGRIARDKIADIHNTASPPCPQARSPSQACPGPNSDASKELGPGTHPQVRPTAPQQPDRLANHTVPERHPGHLHSRIITVE